MAKGERIRSRTLSQGQIKIRILAYLYDRGKDGANAYTIEHRANIPGQEYGRLREFLDEMCRLKLITKYEQETGGDKVGSRTYYKIEQAGIDTVQSYRNSYMPQIFGSVEDIFQPTYTVKIIYTAEGSPDNRVVTFDLTDIDLESIKNVSSTIFLKVLSAASINYFS